MSDRGRFDVAIVGGGPAGVAAALALRKRGIARVAIIERESEIGGVPRHCGHPPFGMSEFGRVLTGPAYARKLQEAACAAGVAIHVNTNVVALLPGGGLQITSPGGLGSVTAKRVLLATGVREAPRSARLISGDRPIGVLTTGTLQQSIYIERLKPFSRPVIVGTELVSLSAVLTCWKAGIAPQAIIETRPRPVARRPMDLFPKLLGIPMYYRAALADIKGAQRVTSVVARLADGENREIACDGVLLTGSFVPEASLARLGHLIVDPGSGGPVIDQFGRCSDPLYFAAGNLLRPVETAGWSFREGRRIGGLLADDLAGLLPETSSPVEIVRGGDIKLAVPQRIDRQAMGGLQHIQLRVIEGGTGRLVAKAGDKLIWHKHASLLPERRILVPIAALRDNSETITIAFERD